MKQTRLAGFEKRAQEIRALHDRIHETLSQQPHGPDHDAACTEFHARYDELAFPGGLAKGLDLLKCGDRPAVELWVQFLEADPKFFRSGYIKEKALRRLKHVELSASQIRRLAHLVKRSVDSGGRREFHGYARLAGGLDDAGIREAMEGRAESRDAEVRRRARNVLEILSARKS